MLRQPGPTHSVFDVLAAACMAIDSVRNVALLGFGGGGVVAALRALGCQARVHAVDLDPTGWNLLTQARVQWIEPITWHRREAGSWIQSSNLFDVVIDDLSVPDRGDVRKPDITWENLPEAAFHHLRPGGLALFNLLRPRTMSWQKAEARITGPFAQSLRIHLDEFENRILVTAKPPRDGSAILEPRGFGRILRKSLRALASRQSNCVRIASV